MGYSTPQSILCFGKCSISTRCRNNPHTTLSTHTAYFRSDIWRYAKSWIWLPVSLYSGSSGGSGSRENSGGSSIGIPIAVPTPSIPNSVPGELQPTFNFTIPTGDGQREWDALSTCGCLTLRYILFSRVRNRVVTVCPQLSWPDSSSWSRTDKDR